MKMNDTSSLQQTNSVQNAGDNKESTTGDLATSTPQLPTSEPSSTETKPSHPSSVSGAAGTSSTNPTTSTPATTTSNLLGQAWGDIEDAPSMLLGTTTEDSPRDTGKTETTLQEAKNTEPDASRLKPRHQTSNKSIGPPGRTGPLGYTRQRRGGGQMRNAPATTSRRPPQNLSPWSNMRLVQSKDTVSPSMHGRASGSPFLGGSTLTSTKVSDFSLGSRGTSDPKASRFSSLTAQSAKPYSLSDSSTTATLTQTKESSMTVSKPAPAAATPKSNQPSVWEIRRLKSEMQKQESKEEEQQKLKQRAFLSDHTTATVQQVAATVPTTHLDEDIEKMIADTLRKKPFLSIKAVKFYRDKETKGILFEKDVNSRNANLWTDDVDNAREESRKQQEKKLREAREEEEKRKQESEAAQKLEEQKRAEEDMNKEEEETQKHEEVDEENEKQAEEPSTFQAASAPPPTQPMSGTVVMPAAPFPHAGQSIARAPQPTSSQFTAGMTQPAAHTMDPAAYSHGSSEVPPSYIMPQYTQGMAPFYVPMGYPHPQALSMPYVYPHMYPHYRRDMPATQGEYGMHQATNRGAAAGVSSDASNADNKHTKNTQLQLQQYGRTHMAPMPPHVHPYPMHAYSHMHVGRPYPGMVPMPSRHPQGAYPDYAPTDHGRLQKPHNPRTYNSNYSSMHSTNHAQYSKSFQPKQPVNAVHSNVGAQRYSPQKVVQSPLQTIGPPFVPDPTNVSNLTGSASSPPANNSPPVAPPAVPSAQTPGNESHVQ